MGWVFILLFALIILAVLFQFGHLRGSPLELAGAVLLLGVAGYAWQGSPSLPGSPTAPHPQAQEFDSVFAMDRTRFFERFSPDAQILDSAEAFQRQGLADYAIAPIRGALEKRPNSAELWVGMAHALTVYANGIMTPAAQLAFDRAAAAAPDHPGPPYFLGLAYAQSGQFDRARQIWTGLLARTPANAPWRATIEQRLAQINAVQAQANGGA